MKIFNRSNLPAEIKYNNRIYKVDMELTAAFKDTNLPLHRCIRVNVLSTRLKNAVDIHNKPYQASKWIFKPIN